MTACMRRQKLTCAPCQRAALLLVPGMLLLLLAAQPRATPQPQPLAARTARSVSAAGDDSGGGSCPPLPRIPEGCVEVQHACVDQGTFVLHGAGYQPDAVSGKAAVALPTWRAAARAHFPYPAAQSNPDYVKLPGLPEPAAFTFRPVSAYEPSPDIASPQWSCQVPVVLQAGWPFNYWHGLANAAAWLYDRLTVPGGPLAQRAVVSVSTPWALGLPPWLRTQLQPMARQPVQTLADLGARSGNSSRCFSSVLLCDTGSEWSSPRVWQASQHIVDSYRPQWEQAHLQLSESSPGHVPQQLRRQQQQLQPGERRRVWRVLFQTRSSAVRQFVNLQELLSECAAWSHLDTATGTLHTAECGTWGSHPLPEGIAVAQAADVVVGCHGANIANSLFMRPGSAVVEVLHPDWNKQFARSALSQDPLSQLHWWGILVRDRRLFSPGANELAQRQAGAAPYAGSWGAIMRDRNVRLPWDTLRGVLDSIARINGSTAAYRAAAEQRRTLAVVAPPGPDWLWQLCYLPQRVWLLLWSCVSG